MKKSTIGLIIFAFGLIGIIGGAQDPQMKNESAFFVVCAVLGVGGLLLFLITRRRRPKTAVKSTGGEESVLTEVKSAPGEPLYCVWAGRSQSYSIPSRCCACAKPAGRTVTISSRQIGNRILSLDFPICQTCYKERYGWISLRAIDPVKIREGSVPGRMEFSFANRDYAEMFAKVNKGQLIG